MDLIIRLILSIFEEIFSQDAKRRREARARAAANRSDGKAPRAEAPRQAPDRGPQGQKQKKGGLLEALFKELEALEGPPSQQRPPRPPAPRQHQPSAQPRETYEEHLAKTKRHADALVHGMERHLGVHADTEKKDASTPFRLPGKTGLEQMIYAQIILGPPKAKRHQRTFF